MNHDYKPFPMYKANKNLSLLPLVSTANVFFSPFFVFIFIKHFVNKTKTNIRALTLTRSGGHSLAYDGRCPQLREQLKNRFM